MELHRYNVYIATQQAKRGSAKQDAPYSSLEATVGPCVETWLRNARNLESGMCTWCIQKIAVGQGSMETSDKTRINSPKGLRVLGNES